jgi:ribonuclease E
LTRRMLINAQRTEEVRVAIVEDSTLEAFQVEVAEAGLQRGNIYRGVVASIQPSLNAAFVDFGVEKHAFLKADDIVPAAYHRHPEKGRHPYVDKVLERGKAILVQVTKDAMGGKGAAVTTNLSIAGRYLVLMPFDDTRGVSRKVEDENARRQIIERVSGLKVPEGYGLIARTNALEQNKTTLSRDLNALLRLWKRVRGETSRGKGPRLLYSDQDLIVQALRDYLDASIEEVLVDNDDVYERAHDYMQAFMPRAKTRLVRYTERMPLFSRFALEPQIEAIYQRTVALPAGGSIVIDATEALTAIDVNSGRFTRGASQEETAFAINIEAANEVGRQLRLRDIGGLVVVDFIDMRNHKHRQQVEKTMRDALKTDRARTWVGRISANGLLEINRQRIKQALQLRTHRPCPTCKGVGSIASPEHVALSLLRRIEAAAVGGTYRGVRISLHPELADAFQNGHRQEVAALEREFDIDIEIIAATSFHRSEEKVEWFDRERAGESAGGATRPSVVSAGDVARARGGKREEKGAKPEARREAEPTAKGQAAAGEAESANEKRRRRRRGGRKHKKAGTDGDEGVEAAASPSNAAEDVPAPEAVPAEPKSADADEGQAAEEAGKAKRRRRHRRRHKKPAATVGNDTAAGSSEASAGSEEAVERPA